MAKKQDYAATVEDKVTYVLERWPTSKTWGFNKFLRTYCREWMEITLPSAFDDNDAVESVRRRLQERKELVGDF